MLRDDEAAARKRNGDGGNGGRWDGLLGKRAGAVFVAVEHYAVLLVALCLACTAVVQLAALNANVVRLWTESPSATFEELRPLLDAHKTDFMTLYTTADDAGVLYIELPAATVSAETPFPVLFNAIYADGTTTEDGALTLLHYPADSTDETLFTFQLTEDESGVDVMQALLTLRTTDAGSKDTTARSVPARRVATLPIVSNREASDDDGGDADSGSGNDDDDASKSDAGDGRRRLSGGGGRRRRRRRLSSNSGDGDGGSSTVYAVDGASLMENGFFVSDVTSAAVEESRLRLNATRAFPRNAAIVIEYTVATSALGGLGETALDSIPEKVALALHFSISAAPAEPMTPRLADERVGFFATTYVDVGDHSEEYAATGAKRRQSEMMDTTVTVVNKRRMDEADLPLTYFIDPSVPEKWRAALRRGVENWRPAFKAIGFGDAAVRAVLPGDADWPEDFEAGDIRYNTITWAVDTEETFALGPATLDPRTGEILHSDIVFTHGWVKAWLGNLEHIDVPDVFSSSRRSRRLTSGGHGADAVAAGSGADDAGGGDAYGGSGAYGGGGDARRRRDSSSGSRRGGGGGGAARFLSNLAAGTDATMRRAYGHAHDDHDHDEHGHHHHHGHFGFGSGGGGNGGSSSNLHYARRVFPGLNRSGARGPGGRRGRSLRHHSRHGCQGLRLDDASIHMMRLLAATPAGGGAVPDSVIEQGLTEVVMHEVGHTLGLRHNFRASSVHPFAQTQNRTFTQQHGLASSVMDYMPMNVASARLRPPGGVDAVDIFSPVIGEYDYWAIEYAYKKVEDETLLTPHKSLLAVADRALPFSTDEDGGRESGMDPYVSVFDLGDEPLEFFSDRLDLVAELRPKLLDRSVAVGEPYSKLAAAEAALLTQVLLAGTYLAKYVGGFRGGRQRRLAAGAAAAAAAAASGGAGEPGPLQSVVADKQRQALALLLRVLTEAPGHGLFAAAASQPYLVKLGGQCEGLEEYCLAVEPYDVFAKMTLVRKAVLVSLFDAARLSRVRLQQWLATPASAGGGAAADGGATGSDGAAATPTAAAGAGEGDALGLPELFGNVTAAIFGEGLFLGERVTQQAHWELQLYYSDLLLTLAASSAEKVEREVAAVATGQLYSLQQSVDVVANPRAAPVAQAFQRRMRLFEEGNGPYDSNGGG